jgi:hypothetical protein
MLINKTWKQQLPGKTFYFIRTFTDKKEVTTLFINEVKSGEDVRNDYYLSDTIVDKFQSNLVGKSNKGKYIIMLRKGKVSGERLVVEEIIELTDTTLKLKAVGNDQVVEYTSN